MRGVNRPTDRQILKIVLPGFRIQSEILTNLKNPGNGSGLRTHPFLGPGFWTLHFLGREFIISLRLRVDLARCKIGCPMHEHCCYTT